MTHNNNSVFDTNPDKNYLSNLNRRRILKMGALAATGTQLNTVSAGDSTVTSTNSSGPDLAEVFDHNNKRFVLAAGDEDGKKRMEVAVESGAVNSSSTITQQGLFDGFDFFPDIGNFLEIDLSVTLVPFWQTDITTFQFSEPAPNNPEFNEYETRGFSVNSPVPDIDTGIIGDIVDFLGKTICTVLFGKKSLKLNTYNGVAHKDDTVSSAAAITTAAVIQGVIVAVVGVQVCTFIYNTFAGSILDGGFTVALTEDDGPGPTGVLKLATAGGYHPNGGANYDTTPLFLGGTIDMFDDADPQTIASESTPGLDPNDADEADLNLRINSYTTGATNNPRLVSQGDTILLDYTLGPSSEVNFSESTAYLHTRGGSGGSDTFEAIGSLDSSDTFVGTSQVPSADEVRIELVAEDNYGLATTAATEWIPVIDSDKEPEFSNLKAVLWDDTIQFTTTVLNLFDGGITVGNLLTVKESTVTTSDTSIAVQHDGRGEFEYGESVATDEINNPEGTTLQVGVAAVPTTVGSLDDGWAFIQSPYRSELVQPTNPEVELDSSLDEINAVRINGELGGFTTCNNVTVEVLLSQDDTDLEPVPSSRRSIELTNGSGTYKYTLTGQDMSGNLTPGKVYAYKLRVENEEGASLTFGRDGKDAADAFATKIDFSTTTEDISTTEASIDADLTSVDGDAQFGIWLKQVSNDDTSSAEFNKVEDSVKKIEITDNSGTYTHTLTSEASNGGLVFDREYEYQLRFIPPNVDGSLYYDEKSETKTFETDNLVDGPGFTLPAAGTGLAGAEAYRRFRKSDDE